MISEFRGKYRFLSNFYPSPITYARIRYPTVEHAFQASKTTDHEGRRRVSILPTPGLAKKAGRRLPLRPDWEDVKLAVMEELLRRKFQDTTLGLALVGTRPHELVEGNTWGDRYWGIDLRTGHGENHLGLLLMKIREEL